MESIEASLDDHLVKTQTMRGSPYFKPFEKEVLGWEAQLTRIQDTIAAWMSVQEKWLYLEPILTVEEIVRHLPTESLLFRSPFPSPLLLFSFSFTFSSSCSFSCSAFPGRWTVTGRL